ncbi:MAG: hypothetical protein K2X46_02730, partial [Roseomonas sp.]|nr:hypothetical protein [Roseomonas sp.]
VLGPILVGRGARVGANAVVVSAVAPGCTVVGIPARPPRGQPCQDPSIGYGLGTADEDPVGEQLAAMRAEIALLRSELGALRNAQREGV